MATENVVVIRFTEPSKAYQALSVLKECGADGRIGLESAAVVERTAAGELRIPESADNVGLAGTASGSLIGMLVGVLGGPVGVLLGWGAGAMMGGAFELDRQAVDDSLRRAAGSQYAEERVDVEFGHAALLHGRHVRQRWQAM